VSREDWQYLLGEAMPRPGLTGLLWRLRIKLFGAPPAVTRLHPRWPDYGLAYAALRKLVADRRRTLLVARHPSTFAEWLTDAAGDIHTLESAHLLEAPPSLYEPAAPRFDACLIMLSEDLLGKADQLIARAGPLLNPGAPLLMLVTNDHGYERANEFSRHFAQQSARLLNLSAWIAETHYVPASRLRWAVYRAMFRTVRKGDAVGWRSPLGLVLLAVVSIPLMLASLAINLRIRSTLTPPRGLWSSVFLVLRRSSNCSLSPPPDLGSRRHKSGKHGDEAPHA
jgi:hypothetical protein